MLLDAKGTKQVFVTEDHDDQRWDEGEHRTRHHQFPLYQPFGGGSLDEAKSDLDDTSGRIIDDNQFNCRIRLLGHALYGFDEPVGPVIRR